MLNKALRAFHLRRQLIWSALIAVLLFVLLLSYPHQTVILTSSSDYNIHYDKNHFDEEQQPQCTPKYHVMLLKTHKCGSSTIQNMLLRYGFQKNLTFALPAKANYLGSSIPFKKSMIPRNLLPWNGKVDIFCLHSRLNPTEMLKVLHPDTVWVTIVRNPVYLFDSLYAYFGLKSVFKMKLETMPNEPLQKLLNTKRSGLFGKDQMLYDLGIEDASVVELARKIRELDQLFDVVLLADRMEESLIILRHKLCWSLQDVVSFKKNARRVEEIRPLSDATIERLKELNSGDMILYEHFVARHEKAVKAFGEERMQQEVEQLRILNKAMYDDCIQAKVKAKDERLTFREYSGLVSSFLLKENASETCQLLAMPELPFVNMVRAQQKNILSMNKL